MLPPKAATTTPPFRSLAATAGLYGSTVRKKDQLFKPTLLRRNAASLVGNLSWRQQWKTSMEEKKGVLLYREQRKRLLYSSQNLRVYYLTPVSSFRDQLLSLSLGWKQYLYGLST